MVGETVRQMSETVNSLKRKITLPSLLLYRFDVLIIPDQFMCWCLFSQPFLHAWKVCCKHLI